MARSRTLTTRALRARAETVRRSLLAARVAHAEELDLQRPGGTANPDRSAEAWLLWLIQLHRLDAQAVGAVASREVAKVEQDARLLEAIRSDPIAIELSTGLRVLVRPLSFEALAHLDGRDLILAWLAQHCAALGAREDATAGDLDLLARSIDEMAYQQRVCASIVTAESAPRLYFDPIVIPRPQPADYTADLDPNDFLRIMRAHGEVNAWRLHAIRPLLRKEGAGERGKEGWGTFFATMEQERNEPAVAYMREHGIVPLIAARVAAAAAERDAMERAKKNAERDARRNANDHRRAR